ncbi:MAG: hypothetical protein ACK4TJ_08280 [Tabrizicola sp.]
MKVIHNSGDLLMIEDRPWRIGLMMIAMALVLAYGGMTILASGEILGGAMLLLIGVGVPVLIGALMVQRVRLTLDRATGRLTRTVRSVRGLSQESHPLDRLIEARVGVSTDSDGTSYRTELHLADPPQIVPFTSYYTSGTKPEAITQAVNDWLARLR